jgi:preprotein translocase, secE subunit
LKLKNSASIATNKHYIAKQNKRKRRFEMRFLSNVIKEMKKVTWPTGKEVNKYTITVIMTVLAALCFFAVVDYGVHQLITFLLK